MERHVLVVLPHPDDEAFGISGTIASYIHNGSPVTYVCLTLGEMGRNMGNPLFANRETLPLIRKKELEDSCKAIGITDLRMLGLRDKTIEFEDSEELATHIGYFIKETNPSLIITFYPGYSVHPDHDATAAAVIRAVERLNKADRPVVHCLAFSNGCEDILGPPDIINDVSAFLEQKLGSITAHQSQFQLFKGRLNGNRAMEDPETVKRISKERFWTYHFSQ